MQLGWIDFSKEDRKKVLSVIDLLSEDGTLDELGVAPIRDGFADLFFPGTSTIQTRAKYFLIVPYALDDLAHQPETNPEALLKKLDDTERRCGEILVTENADGTIGSRTIKSGGWVKRTPADIYWAGMRRYGIFTSGTMSLAEYARASCSLKKQKRELKKLGNRNDDVAEYERDDADAGTLFTASFWKLPPYPSNWMDTLTMALSQVEAEFLKSQIESTQPQTMLAHILRSNVRDVADMTDFFSLGESGLIDSFPQEMQNDYAMALAFSVFFYGARIRYNIILSEGKNEEANIAWEEFSVYMVEYASVDIDAIFMRLKIVNPLLRQFLMTVQQNMRSGDIVALDGCIKKREVQLKGENRAKLNRAGEFPPDKWIGGGMLDYRFGNAMTIVRDIFQGLEATSC